ncbi:MAG TPA: hypothetical protein VGJ81_16010 [Thermoanaerobaculia bacterium]|jgi:hypothetical protein
MRLGVITLGHVHAEELEPLTRHFEHIEQLVLDVEPRASIADHRAELNRAIDAASADWLLLLREREVIDEPLAIEIAAAMEAAKAWGFRIRSIPMYAGKPLRLGAEEGELRLFHRRHFLRRGELSVQGTVVRLNNALRSISFDSYATHREQLAKTGVPHSGLRHLLLFIRYVLGARTLDANTLRYLWIEAGFDMERRTPSSAGAARPR